MTIRKVEAVNRARARAGSELRGVHRALAVAACLGAGAMLATWTWSSDAAPGSAIVRQAAVQSAPTIHRMLAGFAFGFMLLAAWLRCDRSRPRGLPDLTPARHSVPRLTRPLLATALLRSLRRGGRIGP